MTFSFEVGGASCLRHCTNLMGGGETVMIIAAGPALFRHLGLAEGAGLLPSSGRPPRCSFEKASLVFGAGNGCCVLSLCNFGEVELLTWDKTLHPLSNHTNPGIWNMDEEKKLQGSLTNGYAGGQEEEAGYIKQRLLSAWNRHKKAIIIVFVIFIVVAVVFFFLGKHMALNCQHDDIKCPPDWIGYQGHCYKYSEEEKNWNESQNFCILHNASLAKFTKDEMNLTKKFTRDHVFWIGIRRESDQLWKWLDGDNATSEIMGHGGEGGGNCAYLDDSGKAYPGTCSTEHRFICKKNDPKRS